jgi:hypothetical protein
MVRANPVGTSTKTACRTRPLGDWSTPGRDDATVRRPVRPGAGNGTSLLGRTTPDTSNVERALVTAVASATIGADGLEPDPPG